MKCSIHALTYTDSRVVCSAEQSGSSCLMCSPGAALSAEEAGWPWCVCRATMIMVISNRPSPSLDYTLQWTLPRWHQAYFFFSHPPCSLTDNNKDDENWDCNAASLKASRVFSFASTLWRQSRTLLELEICHQFIFHLLSWMVSRLSDKEAHPAPRGHQCDFITWNTGSDVMLFFSAVLEEFE